MDVKELSTIRRLLEDALYDLRAVEAKLEDKFGHEDPCNGDDCPCWAAGYKAAEEDNAD